ncbi:Two-component response regulator-like PRR73, partial [Tetrabaena socialis]
MQDGRPGRAAVPGMAEPKRRRALALDKYRKKRKNLRFSKTIRYESRKQLAQQRPRVRGQFIKHGPDGAATCSNGGKSGADGMADDAGGDEEARTNSRGYDE